MSGMHLAVHYRLDPGAVAPFREHNGDAGWDLHAIEDTFIPMGEYRDIKSGVRIDMPEGWYCRITGRSSALRVKGLIVVEGVIDAGFHGELFACAYCPLQPTSKVMTTVDRRKVCKQGGSVGILVEAGESVAQLVFQPVPHVLWSERSEFAASARGEAGFGSTGR